MSFFKRRQGDVEDEPDTDEEHTDDIDPNLRLRTVRTAASSIAEAGRVEDRQRRRKSRRSRFFTRSVKRKHAGDGDSQLGTTSQVSEPAAPPPPIIKEVPGLRRNVYVNLPLNKDELDAKGEPLVRYQRNKVRTTSAFSSLRSECTQRPNKRRVYGHHVPTKEHVRTVPSCRQSLLFGLGYCSTYVFLPFLPAPSFNKILNLIPFCI